MADELTNILGKRAAFAATFGGTTNLAQRRRYQEDISQYQDAVEQEDQRQFNALNRQAEFADPLKARSVRVSEGRLKSDQEKFDWQTRMDEAKLKLSEETNALRAFQAQAALEREMRSVRDARRIEEDTLSVEREEGMLRDANILPGSPEYAQRITEKLTRHPFVKPQYSDMLLKQARVEADPETIASQWAAKGRRPIISETVHADGRKSFTIRDASEVPPSPDKERRDLEKEADQLGKAMLSADRSMQGYYKTRIQEVNAKLLGMNKPAGAPAAPATLDPARLDALKKLIQQ